MADLNEAETSGTLEVVALINQLEQLEQAANRSVAAEAETALEGAALPDDAGRERILELCKEFCVEVNLDIGVPPECQIRSSQSAIGTPPQDIRLDQVR